MLTTTSTGIEKISLRTMYRIIPSLPRLRWPGDVRRGRQDPGRRTRDGPGWVPGSISFGPCGSTSSLVLLRLRSVPLVHAEEEAVWRGQVARVDARDLVGP